MPSQSRRRSEPLEAARAAVLRSDKAQKSVMGATAKSGETRALRDAVRALIQQVESQQETINGLLQRSWVDPMGPLA